MLDERVVPPVAPAVPEVPNLELDNAAVRVGERVMAAVERQAWDEVEQLFAPDASIESRRKVVGLTMPSAAARLGIRREVEMGTARIDYVMIAARGERLALSRLTTSSADVSPGAPYDELLQLYAIDETGRVALQIWFDVEDMDAAMAELDALHARVEEARPQARRPDNAAKRVLERYLASFAARDWDAMAQILTADNSMDDRRRVVNAGVRKGRADNIANMRAVAEVGVQNVASDVIATRGERLVLGRVRVSGRDQRPEPFETVDLHITEIDEDERIVGGVVFDLDDFDAAIAELDARYLAGEAAAHAHTWSALTGAFAAINRRELPERTPDWVNVDHRRGAAFATGEMTAYIHDLLHDAPDINVHIEVVHRLSNLGAVVTSAAHGTSQQGFEAEWREIQIFTFDGDLLSRCELFDETDLDAAIARFEQLGQPVRRLENAASRVFENEWSHFAARDWDALAELVADNYSGIDHRRVVRAENQHGRDVVVKDLQAAADVGFTISMVSAIAIRGERLVLARVRAAGRDPKAIQNDALNVVEIDAEERIVAAVTFDLEDFDAAMAELESRYITGEAAAHAHTWSVIAESYAAVNRQEFPAISPDSVLVDHRRAAAFGVSDLSAYLRAGLDLGQNIRPYIEAVHRLSDRGAVCNYAAQGVSHEGFDAEWQGIDLVTVDGDMIDRHEFFDEADIDASIARFEELSQPAQRLENAATHVYERMWEYFRAQDWVALTALVAEDELIDDRRRVVNGGVRQGRNAGIQELQAAAGVGFAIRMVDVKATRGDRLALTLVRASGRDPDAVQNDVLQVVEIDSHERIARVVTFDVDDFDAAITELDARYLAGEAAAHARTWSVVARGLRRTQPARTSCDDAGLGERRPSACGINGAR